MYDCSRKPKTLLVQCLTLLVVYPEYTTKEYTKSTKEEKTGLIRVVFQLDYPFFVPVHFVVNRNKLL